MNKFDSICQNPLMNTTISTDPTKITIVTSVNRFMKTFNSILMTGNLNKTDLSSFATDNNTYLTRTACGDELMESIELSNVYIQNMEQTNYDFMNHSDLNIVLITKFDVNSIEKITQLITNAPNVVFLISKNVTPVDMHKISSIISSKMVFEYIPGNTFCSNQNIMLLKELIVNIGQLHEIEDLKRIDMDSEKQLYTYTSITQYQREKCVSSLKNVADEMKINIDAEEMEKKIFDAVKGDLSEYILAHRHQIIKIQNQNNPQALGKRSRSEFLQCSMIPDETYSYKPTVKWHYSVPADGHIMAIQGCPSVPMVLRARELDKETGLDELEVEFRNNRFHFEKKLPGFDTPVKINLWDYQITYKDVTRKALHREMSYMGNVVKPPSYWSAYQEETIQLTKLKIDEDEMYRIFADEIKDKLNGTVLEIVQLQNFQQLNNFTCELNSIMMNLEDPNHETIFLYYGSNYVYPMSIIEDINGIPCDTCDIDPNKNWGKGIHMSDDIRYADERAFCDKERGIRQIFVVNTFLGNCVNMEYNEELKRPPQKTAINNMPVFYNSVSGEYKTDQFAACVSVVYNSNQVLPAYLLTYSVTEESCQT